MTDLQALVTGVLQGLLLRERRRLPDISSTVVLGADGNWLPKLVIRGNQSGDVVVVSVDAYTEGALDAGSAEEDDPEA